MDSSRKRGDSTSSNYSDNKPVKRRKVKRFASIEDRSFVEFDSIYGTTFIDNGQTLNEIMQILTLKPRERLFLFCQSRGYGKTRTALELCRLKNGIFLSFGKARNSQPIRTNYVLDCNELKFSTYGFQFETWILAVYRYRQILLNKCNEKYSFVKAQKIPIGGCQAEFMEAVSQSDYPEIVSNETETDLETDPMLLFLDEAHHLLDDDSYDFSNFLSAIDEKYETLLKFNIKIILLSTNTTLTNFMKKRGKFAGAIRPLVFSYFDIASDSTWFRLGRPHYSKSVLYPGISERSRMEALYADLIIDQSEQNNSNICQIKNLACAAIRLCLDIMPIHQIASTLVNKHMATLLYIGKDGKSAVVTYPSEPLLVEAAAYCWYHDDGKRLLKIIEGLELSHLTGLVLKGLRGELVAKIVFLLVADSENRKAIIKGRSRQLTCYHNYIPLHKFMNALVGDDVFEATERVKDARLRLSHWIHLDFKKFDSSILARMYDRGCGGMFDLYHKASDLLVPLFFEDSNSFGAVLIQVKCYSRAQMPSEISAWFRKFCKETSLEGIKTSECVCIVYDAAVKGKIPSKVNAEFQLSNEETVPINAYYVPIFGKKIDLLKSDIKASLIRIVSPRFQERTPPIGKQPIPSVYLRKLIAP